MTDGSALTTVYPSPMSRIDRIVSIPSHSRALSAKLLEEDMIHMEWGMNRRLVMTIVLWMMIIILAAIIAAVVAILVSPETFRALGQAIIDFFDIELDFDFWRIR